MSNDQQQVLWQAGRFGIDLSRPRVMGIVNVTPDSFSDGGRHAGPGAALAHAEALLREGADILDIGAESTRPGAQAPGADEELSRLLPVLREAVRLGCPVSVDTSEPRVIAEALALGVDIINDVRALRRPGALEAVRADARCGICLMHMQGEPQHMQIDPRYQDVVSEVSDFLAQRRNHLSENGIALSRLVLDPGFGFGKTLEHNLSLTRALPRLSRELGLPLLVGWSRKGTLGHLTGRPVDQRQSASVAAALACVAQGASILRVHDVAATVDALKVWAALGPTPKE
ncbi:MAG: dihydropteroate synthase [Rubrivivax sp.]|nr:dihydropteroate synthase [Rubrivivax sp.]